MLGKLLRLEAGFVDLARFGLARNLKPSEVERLLDAVSAVRLGGFGLLSETRAQASGDMIETLKAFHASNGDTAGLQPERLRLAMKKRWPQSVFQLLLDHEVAAKTIVVDGPYLRLPGHSLKLGARDEALWQKISAELVRERFKPPRVRDFAQTYGVPEADVRRLMRRLAQLGRLVEIAPDQYFLRPVVAEMIGIAHGFGVDFTAAQFRDKLDNGRKVAILILEFFDRHGITMRRGDLRRTVPAKLGQYGPVPRAESE